MTDEAELLWGMFEENIAYSRHHETLRGTVTNLIVVVSAGVIGLMTLNGGIDLLDLPLAIFLSALGVFGAFFTAKHYERYRMHDTRLDEIKRRLDELVPAAKLIEMESRAMETHKKNFPVMHRLRLKYFWMALNLFIAAIGVVLSGFCFM